MAAPLVYAIIVQVGRKFLGTNSKRIADALIKKGGKRIPKTKLPKNAKVSKAPDVVTKAPNVKLPLKKPNADKLPKNVQLRKDPPVARKSTTPKKADQPKTPAKPKVGTKAPAKIKKPNTLTTVTKPKPRPTRNKPPLTRVPGRTNPVPKKLRGTPAAARIAPLESGPEIDKSSIKPTSKQKTDRGFKPKVTPRPKKTGKTDRTAPPRAASGPVTNESFGKAFRRNRNAGKPTFMWKGKKYTTRLKEETIAQHKKKFGVSGNY
tara:strand:+ start:467 stop:1255 length:789 start_codon:yes stop_codon:yes gene_type:complete